MAGGWGRRESHQWHVVWRNRGAGILSWCPLLGIGIGRNRERAERRRPNRFGIESGDAGELRAYRGRRRSHSRPACLPRRDQLGQVHGCVRGRRGDPSDGDPELRPARMRPVPGSSWPRSKPEGFRWTRRALPSRLPATHSPTPGPRTIIRGKPSNECAQPARVPAAPRSWWTARSRRRALVQRCTAPAVVRSANMPCNCCLTAHDCSPIAGWTPTSPSW